MLEQVRVDVYVGPTTTRVAISGALDYDTVGAVEARLVEVRGERATSDLIVDLAGTTFLDSAVMRLLVEAWRHALDNGYTLSIVRAPAGVHRAMQIAGLEQVLPFIDRAELEDLSHRGRESRGAKLGR